MVDHVGIAARTSMPPSLPYVLRAHPLLTMLSKPVLLPAVAFGMSWVRTPRMQASPSVYFPWLRYLLIAWIAIALLWALARLGPAVGTDDNGIWFRSVLWLRKTRFVPWSQLESVEVSPRELGRRGFVCGAKLRLHTAGGPIGRLPRFVPCDEEHLDGLLDVLAEHDARVEVPTRSTKHVAGWIFGVAVAVLIAVVVAVVWSESR